MAFIIRLLIVGLAATGVILGISLTTAQAQSSPMTEQQIERIKGSCLSVKNTLRQLHSSDALLRVNGGQVYESMSTKLMKQFNGRVSYNNLDNTGLVEATDDYNLTLNNFRLKYKAYEEQLSRTLDIDCLKQPVAFYDAVAAARTKRADVYTQVVDLNDAIDDYQLALVQFESDFKDSNGAKQ